MFKKKSEMEVLLNRIEIYKSSFYNVLIIISVMEIIINSYLKMLSLNLQVEEMKFM